MQDRLDEALIRPGRVDYEIEFKEATAGIPLTMIMHLFLLTHHLLTHRPSLQVICQLL